MPDKDIDPASTTFANGFTPGHDVRAFTGLRSVAAVDVVIGHYDIHNIPAVHAFVFNDAAVDIFFTCILAPFITTLICASISFFLFETLARRLIRWLLAPRHLKPIRQGV